MDTEEYEVTLEDICDTVKVIINQSYHYENVNSIDFDDYRQKLYLLNLVGYDSNICFNYSDLIKDLSSFSGLLKETDKYVEYNMNPNIVDDESIKEEIIDNLYGLLRRFEQIKESDNDSLKICDYSNSINRIISNLDKGSDLEKAKQEITHVIIIPIKNKLEKGINESFPKQKEKYGKPIATSSTIKVVRDIFDENYNNFYSSSNQELVQQNIANFSKKTSKNIVAGPEAEQLRNLISDCKDIMKEKYTKGKTL